MLDRTVANAGRSHDEHLGSPERDARGGPRDWTGFTRMDTHCHSSASSGPVMAAAGWVGCPESYSPPEKVYEQARARGMDLVTLTDHDTIAGGLELVERGFPGVILGEEVTVEFPEDRCKLHVLVWALTPELHEQIGAQGLRQDVYQFAAWLRLHNLPHSLAHPLYIQNRRLSAWHLDRCALLFKGFEILNGAHAGTHRRGLESFLDALTPAKVLRLVDEHGIEPLWPRIWEKALTGGSDDHALLNVGRTFTAVASDDGAPITDPREFFRQVMHTRSRVGGEAGHSSLLAHQLAAVAAQHYARTLDTKASPRSRAVSSRLLRFAGIRTDKPGKASLVLDTVRSQVRARLRGQRSRSLPIVAGLREAIGPLLQKYPDLRASLSGPECALASHERMAAFADDLYAALHTFLGSSAGRALRARDTAGLLEHGLSYLLLELTQLPYLVSLFHQNKERPFVERLEHEHADPEKPGRSPLERPMRVSLFTDTFADINGVSRFIRNMAEQALAHGEDLHVVTSTRLAMPAEATENVFNFDPVFATKMPKYEQLELALPPLTKILRHIDAHQPDVIHISTPGPVGLVGYIAARMLKVPVLGVYHTDFPAYVEHLFDDEALTWTAQRFMRFFYDPFTSIFTRSEDYVGALERLGMDRAKILALRPGVDTSTFHRGARDPSIWSRFPGVRPEAVKVIFVGRVSLEKNMPFLEAAWKQADARLSRAGVKADLVIVGDGPYRAQMQERLAGRHAHFLGFRHGAELTGLYASSDLFAFPSLTDTLGQVVMEAQACGVPVMVADQGGPKEVVTHGQTGLVLPADDRAWADALVELCSDRARLASMGEAAWLAMQGASIGSSFEHFWRVHREAWHAHLARSGLTPETLGRARVRPGRPVERGAPLPGFEHAAD
jgi:glycosyltransferase involved in cell wall biosynthesis